MKPAYTLLAALVLLATLASPAHAQLQIIAVHYDPQGADAGKEWVQLFNNGDETIDLSSYRLETGNGANPNAWTIEWRGVGELQPQQTLLIGEMADADIVVNMDLQNGPDAVRIISDDHVDLVGWGNHTYDEYYEGEPAIDKGDGWGIQRSCYYQHTIWSCVDTDNNAEDFVAVFNLTPFYLSRFPAHPIQTTINSSSPTITKITVPDELPAMPGIQVLPSRTAKNIVVNYTVEQGAGSLTVLRTLLDPDGVQIAQMQHNILCADTCVHNDTIAIPGMPGQGNWTVVYTVGTVNVSQQFTIMPFVAIDVEFNEQPAMNSTTITLGIVRLRNPLAQTLTVDIGYASLHNATVNTSFSQIALDSMPLLHGKMNSIVMQPLEERTFIMTLPRTLLHANSTAYRGMLWVDIR